MQTALHIAQLIISIFLIIVILLQARGAGAGGIFGGGDAVYSARRGAEKILHNLTIILSVLFLTIAFVSLFLN